MSRRHVWRRLLAVLVAMVGIGVLAVALPTTAGAIPGISDCKNAPTPEVPGRGVEGFFQPAPSSAPTSADPFAQGATTSIYEQYGYAGLRWSTYDLGCTGGAGSPEASVGTTVANWLFTIPKAVVAATGAMLGAAYDPQFLSVFDPLIATVVDALRRSVFDQWAGLVLAGVGFLIIWRARRSSLRGTAAALGWALFVMVLATALFRWPVAAGQAADATVVSTMSAVTSALDQHDAAGRSSTGTLAAGNLHEALLYQVWLGGEFGDANSVAARRYGPQLFQAQALTWSEAATLNADPAAGQRIIEAKEAKFKQIAAAVQAEDPDAYEYLTGRRSDARIGFAALSVLAVACAVPFLLAAALLVVGALVITRIAVMMFPAIATLGLFPTMRGIVTGMGNTVAAAVINALMFGVSSAVMVTAYGTLMAPGNGLPSWLVVALVLLLTLVMWFTLRPFHRLTAMAAPGRQHAAHGLGSVTRGLGRVSGRVAGGALGVIVGDGGGDRQRRDDDAAEPPSGRRAEAITGSDADDDAGVVEGTPDELAGTGATGSGRRRPWALGVGGGSGRSAGTRGPEEGGVLAAAGESGAGDEPDAPTTDGAERPAARGATRRGEDLVAADVGLPAVAGRRPERPRGASSARPRPDGRSEEGSRAGGPSRRSGRVVRRSEGSDLGDLGTSASGREPGTAGEAADDAYAVYRPKRPAGGSGRA